jgi:hypothetical protein
MDENSGARHGVQRDGRPWSAGSLPSCVLHRRTDRLFRRRKTDLRVTDSPLQEPAIRRAAPLVAALMGWKAIVKHFPCALLAAMLYVHPPAKLRIFCSQCEFSLCRNPPGISSLRIRAFSACSKSVSRSLQEALGLTEAKPASSRLAFDIPVACRRETHYWGRGELTDEARVCT